MLGENCFLHKLIEWCTGLRWSFNIGSINLFFKQLQDSKSTVFLLQNVPSLIVETTKHDYGSHFLSFGE